MRVSRVPQSHPVFVPVIDRIISRLTNGNRVASGMSQSRRSPSTIASL